ncbi:MAG: Crp/Fnr family transcriptional regulator [Xenococcaceae cyanobacterium MO_207.B15]|nr:Crp/Fnr family transcriptional regulator [Xenococcaceae cyanobacterium MO_207.B15]MDJ0746452.1 Crp/Fnr family transcriptional regulator [Xenococcaceae cyanobacterium MO_167.B27]
MLVSAIEENLQLFYANEQLPLSSEYLWLIIDGVVKSSTINEKGKNVTLSYWGAKDVVGKPLSGNRLCILECVTSVRAEKIYVQDWQKLSPAVFRYGQQVKELSNIIRTGKAPQRLLLLLDWLANKFSERLNPDKSINFNITHQELSEIIGVSRITVTKILNQFEQEGVISRPERNTIIVH